MTRGLCGDSGKSLPIRKAAQEGRVPEKKPLRGESHTDWEPKASTHPNTEDGLNCCS